MRQTEVAVKRLRREILDDPQRGRLLRQLFLNEAAFAGKLSHPHIVRIHDAMVTDHYAWLVVDYVPGGTLDAIGRPHSQERLPREPHHNSNFTPVNWEEFKNEPLKSVDLRETKAQRTAEEVEKLAEVLVKYKHLLSDGTLDFKSADTKPHSTTAVITTTEDNPRIVARNYGCNPSEAQDYLKTIKQQEEAGVIEPSQAPWCSNALLIRKDGKIRMVIDYRALNKITIKDSYPMPRIQDVTDALQGANWFTGIDCVQAFHQIPMGDERSKELTTFKGSPSPARQQAI